MSSDKTQAVLERHLGCFGANDLDGIMADYADDAIVFTPDGVVRGPEAIRELFAGMFPVFPTGQTSLDMKQLSVEGEFAYICWSAEGPAHEAPIGTDTFLVRDGRIVMQSFAALLHPK